MKTCIRNILYWTKRLIFDSIFKRYKDMQVIISDEDMLLLYEAAYKQQMTIDQFVEHALKKYIKDKKLVEQVFDKPIDLKGKKIINE
jgi:hypothetical protein